MEDLPESHEVRRYAEEKAELGRKAKEAGARYGGVLYVDSLSAEGGPVPTYLDLLKVTVETIAKGFGK